MKKTTTEADIRALVAQGKKFPEIAQELEVNLWLLRSACCVLGIKSPKRTHNASKFYDDLCVGMTMREIGTKYGVSGQFVHRTLRRAGLPTTHGEILAQQRKAA